MCCSYTILAFIWMCLVFTYNSYIVTMLVSAAVRTGSKSLFVPGVLCVMPDVETFEERIETVIMEHSDLKAWKTTDIGKEVVVEGYDSQATLVFVGRSIAGRARLGVVFKEQIGKHSGLVKDHPIDPLHPGTNAQDTDTWIIAQYFRCSRRHGILINPSKVTVQMPMSDSNLWKVADVGTKVGVAQYPHKAASIKFVGVVANGEVKVGVAFDEPIGTMDGTVKNRMYFKCEDQHGLLTSPHDVVDFVSKAHALWGLLSSNIEQFQPPPMSKWGLLKGRLKEFKVDTKGIKPGIARVALDANAIKRRSWKGPRKNNIEFNSGADLAGHLRKSLRKVTTANDDHDNGDVLYEMLAPIGTSWAGSEMGATPTPSAVIGKGMLSAAAKDSGFRRTRASVKKAVGGLVPYKDQFIFARSTSRIEAQKILSEYNAEDGTFLIRRKFAAVPTLIISLKVKKNFAGNEENRFEHHAMSLEGGQYKANGQSYWLHACICFARHVIIVLTTVRG